MNRWLFLLLSLLLTACGGDERTRMPVSEPGGLLLNERHGDNGLAWGLEACDGCHAMAVIHQDASNIIRDIVRDKGYETCTGCHGSNGTSALRQCQICHNDSDLPGAPFLDGHHSHTFTQRQASGLTDEDCLVCHQVSDMDGVFDLNRDLSKFMDAYGQPSDYLAQADFCLRCHNRDHQQSGFEMVGEDYSDPLVALEDDYRHIDYHGWRDGSGEGTYHGLRAAYRYPQLVDCSDCHALHGTSNGKLIIDRSIKGARMVEGAQFSGNSYRIEVGEEGDYSQLCVICHEMTYLSDEGALDTGNGLSGVHLVGEDCRPCHTHGEASQVGL